MEIAGSEWLVRARDHDIPVCGGMMYRLEHHVCGVSQSTSPAGLRHEPPPSHFGYDEYEQVAEALDFEDRYMVMDQAMKSGPMFFPENVRPKCTQWTEGDFAKLRADQTAAQIYSNGEFEVWRVYGK